MKNLLTCDPLPRTHTPLLLCAMPQPTKLHPPNSSILFFFDAILSDLKIGETVYYQYGGVSKSPIYNFKVPDQSVCIRV